MPANKRFFVEQLRRQISSGLATTTRAEQDAFEASRMMATEAEKKEDGRVAIEFGNLAKAQGLRARQTRGQIEELDAFLSRQPLPSYGRGTPIGLGAIVDVADEGSAEGAERTFILLPVGAGAELTGPNGDGFLSVVTPASPMGRALMGKRVGDLVEIALRDDVREWTVVDVS